MSPRQTLNAIIREYIPHAAAFDGNNYAVRHEACAAYTVCAKPFDDGPYIELLLPEPILRPESRGLLVALLKAFAEVTKRRG